MGSHGGCGAMWVGGEGSVDENGQLICAQKVNEKKNNIEMLQGGPPTSYK